MVQCVKKRLWECGLGSCGIYVPEVGVHTWVSRRGNRASPSGQRTGDMISFPFRSRHSGQEENRLEGRETEASADQFHPRSHEMEIVITGNFFFKSMLRETAN